MKGLSRQQLDAVLMQVRKLSGHLSIFDSGRKRKMFGIPTIRMFDEEYFETPEEAEQWIREHPKYKILAAYKEPDERFRSYRFNMAIMRNMDMRKYNAVVIYQWRP